MFLEIENPNTNYRTAEASQRIWAQTCNPEPEIYKPKFGLKDTVWLVKKSKSYISDCDGWQVVYARVIGINYVTPDWVEYTLQSPVFKSKKNPLGRWQVGEAHLFSDKESADDELIRILNSQTTKMYSNQLNTFCEDFQRSNILPKKTIGERMIGWFSKLWKKPEQNITISL